MNDNTALADLVEDDAQNDAAPILESSNYHSTLERIHPEEHVHVSMESVPRVQRLVSVARHNALLLLTLFGVFLGFVCGFGIRAVEPTASSLMWTGNAVHNMTEGDVKKVSFASGVRSNLLLILTLVGVGTGFGLGFGIRPLVPSEEAMVWIGLPGEMYMRMLKMTILPLVIASVIAGTASLDPKSNGRISGVALAYILVTNTLGVLVGLVVSFTINPGSDISVNDEFAKSSKKTLLQTGDIFADMIRNLFPDNVVTACFQKAQTSYSESESLVIRNNTNITVIEHTRVIDAASGTNILGLIIVCSIVGMATAKVGEVGRPFLLFFQATSDIIIQVLKWLVWFTPIGVASLISSSIAKVPNIEETFKSVGMLVLSVAVSVTLINVIIIPLAFFIFIRTNPFVFLYNALRPMMAAFAPPSTAVSIPEMLTCCELKHGVDKRISRFTVPFGAALNRIGSCAFIFITARFLCVLEGVDLHAGQILFVAILVDVSSLAIPSVPSGSVIAVLIILSSIQVQTTNIGLVMALEWFIILCATGSFAIPAVPSSSIIIILIVLSSVNVTSTYVGLVMAVEWLTDRLRTTCNCLSVTFGTIFTYKICKSVLPKVDATTDTDDDVALEIKANGTSNAETTQF